jgi:hypothetical protein
MSNSLPSNLTFGGQSSFGSSQNINTIYHNQPQ